MKKRTRTTKTETEVFKQDDGVYHRPLPLSLPLQRVQVTSSSSVGWSLKREWSYGRMLVKRFLGRFTGRSAAKHAWSRPTCFNRSNSSENLHRRGNPLV